MNLMGAFIIEFSIHTYIEKDHLDHSGVRLVDKSTKIQYSKEYVSYIIFGVTR